MTHQPRRGRPSNIVIPPYPEPQIPALNPKPGPPPARPPRPSPSAHNETLSSRNRSKPASARSSPAVNKPSIAPANETVENWPLSDDWRPRRPKEPPRSSPSPRDRSRLPRPTPSRPPRPEDVQPAYGQHPYDWADPYAAESQHYPPPQHFHGTGQWYGDGYGHGYEGNNFRYEYYNNYDYDYGYDHNSYAWEPLQQASAETHPGHPAFSPHGEPSPPTALPDYSQSQRGNVVNRIPLGPPPSARRGPACYYPEFAPVHPIVEERESVAGSIRNSDRKSGRSSDTADLAMVSEHAVSPIATHEASLVNSSSVSSLTHPVPRIPDDRSPTVREERHQDAEETGVVRQASLGKRSRPTLTSVKNGDNPRSPKDGRSRSRTASSTAVESPPTAPPPELPKETFLLSDSEATSTSKSVGSKGVSPARSYEASSGAMPDKAVHPGDRAQKPARIRQSKAWDAPRSSSKAGDASKGEVTVTAEPDSTVEPEAQPVRSSSTPSAIVANYYSGALEKRNSILGDGAPLSSPGVGFSESSRKPRPRPRPLDVSAVREAEARGSLSSLNELIRRATKLASNLDRGKTASRLGMDWWDNPTGDEKRKSGMSVASMLNAFPPPINPERHSTLSSDSDAGKELRRQKRRVCGMPLWAFILLLLLILLLVAAAVIIPVTLLVLPSQKNHNGTRDSTQVTVMSCSKQLSCQNAGTLIVGQNGDCQCLCVNGHTGPTCSTSSPAGCTEYILPDGHQTDIGQAVAPVLADAEDMDIPVDASSISGLFSSSNLSCLAQNALVSFNGGASSGTSPASSTELEFARVAVLYVFQKSRNLGDAVSAQQNLQMFFTSGEGNGSNVTLADGMSCDLGRQTIKGRDGVVVGGKT